MSKKIAAGANAIVLDVKVGSGAFMKTEDDAIALAGMMLTIGAVVGRRMTAVISDMEQPLGQAVGNSLEVAEAIATLRGLGPADLAEHCLVIATEMLLLAGSCTTAEAARSMLRRALHHGKAFAKFCEWVEAQGADPEVVAGRQIMPRARLTVDLPAPCSGYVARIAARDVGLAMLALGGGRQKKGESVDHAAGVVLKKKVGEQVQEGETLLTLHANDEGRLAEAQAMLLQAYRWSSEPVVPAPLIRRIMR